MRQGSDQTFAKPSSSWRRFSWSEWFSRALMGLCALLIADLFWYVQTHTASVYPQPLATGILFSAGLALVLWVLSQAISHLPSPQRRPTVWLTLVLSLTLAGLFLRLVWGLGAPTVQVQDFERMWQTGGQIARGDLSAFKPRGYLHIYPHIALATLYYGAIQWVAPGAIWLAQLLNVVWSMIGLWLFYKMASLITGRPCLEALLVGALCLPMIAFLPVLDSQQVAMPFLWGAAFLYLALYKHQKPLWLYLGVGALLGIGNLFRSVGLIFLIAMAMHSLWLPSGPTSNKRKDWVWRWAGILLIIIGMQGSAYLINTALIQSKIMEKPTWDSGGTLILYINAGFNHQSKGMWNQYDYDLLRDVNFDYQKADQEARRRLQERLRDKGAVMRLLRDKFHIQWGSGDCAGFYWSTVQADPSVDSFQARQVRILRENYPYLQYFYGGVLLLAFANSVMGIFRKAPKERAGYFPFILFIGFVCLYSLIEMQPRYALVAAPALWLMAITGTRRSKPAFKGGASL